MDNRYGVAVIGAGDRGRTYSRAFKEFRNIRLAAVCDIQKDRTEKAQQDFGYVQRYSDYKEAVLQEGVDIVVICTPAKLHPEIATFAMKQGKHVISEKPMGLSLKEAREMMEAAEENRVQLALGFQYHNFPRYRKVKHAFEQGLMGRPVLIRFTDYREVRPKIKMHDAAEGNGGPIVDMSCHFLDLMRWYFESEPVKVNSQNFTFGKERPELKEIEHKAPDTASIMVEFASGDVGSIVVCWGLPPAVNGDSSCDVAGSKGLLEVSEDKVLCKMEGQRTEILIPPSEQREVENPEATVIKHFMDAIEGRGEPQRGGRDGYIALAASLAALKSAAEGRPVTIKEIMDEQPEVIQFIRE